MQGSRERRRLMQQMYREPAYPRLTVAVCAAGLALVALVASVDLGGEPNHVDARKSVHAEKADQPRDAGARLTASPADR